MWDDESGYDLSDPKHPTYAERMFDRADEQRKREREQPVLPPIRPPMNAKGDNPMSRNDERAQRGLAAIKQHPDYVSNDVTTSAADTIADVLHGATAAGIFDGRCSSVEELLDLALRTFEGDAEDVETPPTMRVIRVAAGHCANGGGGNLAIYAVSDETGRILYPGRGQSDTLMACQDYIERNARGSDASDLIVDYGLRAKNELGYVLRDRGTHAAVYQSDSKSEVIAEAQRRKGWGPVDGSEQTYGRQIDEHAGEAR